MIKSNTKSLLDNTAKLYKQTASSRHDVCLDQRSFKCKILDLEKNGPFYYNVLQLFVAVFHIYSTCEI